MSIERLEIDKTSHISKKFLLVICAKGQMTAKINSTAYPMEGPSILVIPPMLIYSISGFTPDNEMEIFPIPDRFIQKQPFTPDFNFLKRVSTNPYTRITENTAEDIRSLVSMIRKYDSEDIRRSEYIIGGLTTSVILIASSSYKVSQVSPYSAVNGRLLQYFRLYGTAWTYGKYDRACRRAAPVRADE